MIQRIIVVASLLLSLLGCNVSAQQESYYGWIDEGEGIAKGFHLKVDLQKKLLADTVEVLYSQIHSEVYPPPEKTSGWKVLFRKITPFRIHVISFVLQNDSIRFTLEKFQVNDKEWFKISFGGRINVNHIKGIISQEEYISYGASHMYSENYNIEFSK